MRWAYFSRSLLCGIDAPRQKSSHGPPALNPYAAAALQAAQWSMANGYSGPGMHDQPGMDMAAMQYLPSQHQHQQMHMPGMPAHDPYSAASGASMIRKAPSIWPPSFEEANAAWNFKAEIGRAHV